MEVSAVRYSEAISAFAGWAAHELYRLAQEKGVNPIEWVGVTASVLFVLFAAWRPTFRDFAPFALVVIGLASILAALEVMRKRGLAVSHSLLQR